MKEAEIRFELIDPALAVFKQSLRNRAFRDELTGSKVNETLSTASSKTSTQMVRN
jgi:hypothetical protein